MTAAESAAGRRQRRLAAAALPGRRGPGRPAALLPPLTDCRPGRPTAAAVAEHRSGTDPASSPPSTSNCSTSGALLPAPDLLHRGDTRKRGEALLEFAAAYKAAGCEVDGGELPDYLAGRARSAPRIDAGGWRPAAREPRRAGPAATGAGQGAVAVYRHAVERRPADAAAARGRRPGRRRPRLARRVRPAREQVGLATVRDSPSSTTGATAMNVLLWVVVPYLAIVVLVGGLIWRYRYDKFGWTTRSSQLYESRSCAGAARCSTSASSWSSSATSAGC